MFYRQVITRARDADRIWIRRDPHYFLKLDPAPIRIRVKSWTQIRIRTRIKLIKVKL